MKRRQKGSQVEEGELERLTMRGKDPKQHALPELKKNRGKGGHSETCEASQAGLISVSARAEVPILWKDGVN